jgi:hypothetical protein
VKMGVTLIVDRRDEDQPPGDKSGADAGAN